MERIGRYQVIAEIGHGGMATVYQARDFELDREVAVKLLLPHLSHDESFKRRFEREAQIVARLEHPHIVPIYDVGEHENRPFLVMRLLQGGNLRDRLKNGHIPLDDLWNILRHIAQALDTAHGHQIVHRDVKPSNILFDEHDSVFVSDFGIAKVIDATTKLTDTGGFLGSLAYMSPEQFTSGEISGRSDQYSLAVLVFETLAGRLPFEGDTAQMIYQHLQDTPPELHKINHEFTLSLSAVLTQALAKQPESRFGTVVEFVQALEQAYTATTLPPLNPVPSLPAEMDNTSQRRINQALALALQMYRQGDWQGALDQLQMVLQVDPRHRTALVLQRNARNRLQTVKERPSLLRSRSSKRVHRQSASAAQAHQLDQTITTSSVVDGAGGTVNVRNWRNWSIGSGILIVIAAVVLLFSFTQPQPDDMPTDLVVLSGPTQSPDSTDISIPPTLSANMVDEVVPSLTLSVGRTPTGARWQVNGSGGAVEEGMLLPFSNGGDLSLNNGAGTMLLILPNNNQLFLDRDTEVRILTIAGFMEAAETHIMLENGRLVIVSEQAVVVENVYGARAGMEKGVLGISFTQQPFLFDANCFSQVCHVVGDLGGDLQLIQGQGSLVGGNGQPSEPRAIRYERYMFASVIPTPTTTPVPRPSSTPTSTRTPSLRLPTQVVGTRVVTATATVMVDTDGDGVPDINDNCDEWPGPAENGGCPQTNSSNPTSPPPANPTPNSQPTNPTPLPQPTSSPIPPILPTPPSNGYPYP